MNTAVTSANLGGDKKLPFLEQLRANQKLPLILGASLAIAAFAAFWLWSRAPDYRVLFSNLSDRDGGAIIASLQQMNIPYKFAEGGGAVLVAAEQVHEARLRLASQGLPKGGSVGFELMDNEKFGVSQFAEQVNYQRALEGELARSVESISAVEAARIHLALPKPSLFVRDQQKPSASVVITLYHGRSLDDGQVSAIAHLVSSSVPELSAKNVTIIDQSGNLLSTASASSHGLDASQLKYSQAIEQSYIHRIEAILQPIVGATNVRAQVAADIDFSTVEHTDEKYSPNQDASKAAIRSQQTSDATQQGAAAAGGVPGALSNQPPINPTAPLSSTPASPASPAPAAGAAGGLANPANGANASAGGNAARSGGSSNVRRDVTTNYEVDHSISHVQQSAGIVKRLSVAVVVNYRGAANAQGKIGAQALPAAEMEQVKNLVKQAMGFSAERGDSLNVVNSQFAGEAPEPELPVWRQPANIELAKAAAKYLLLGVAALWLWFGMVRPLLRKYLQGPVAPTNVPTAALNMPPEPSPEQIKLGEEARQRAADNHQHNLQHAQSLAEKDPRLVAMVIKNWVGNDE